MKIIKYSHFGPLYGSIPRFPARPGPWYVREMVPFHASFDATEWTFMDFGYLYDFWPFLGVKNGLFGPK